MFGVPFTRPPCFLPCAMNVPQNLYSRYKATALTLTADYNFCFISMGLIGSVAGGALGAIGSIFGGMSASRAMKKVKKNLQGRMDENEDWYNRRYNEDATQRADAQRILNYTQQRLLADNRAAEGRQAVGGLSDEATALTKAEGVRAMGDAASQIAMAGDRRKDYIEATYQTKDAELNDALNNAEMKRAEAISSAAQGVAQAGTQMASAF